MHKFPFRPIATVVLVLATSALPAHAAKFSVLYNFKHASLGYPEGRLHFLNGHLFGTGSADYNGGYAGDGQVFELTNSGGTWKENSPLIFDGTDGSVPTAGLIHDSHGILYGTTSLGDAFGQGNVFGVQKTGIGWVHGTIWAFGGTSGDGQNPTCDLIMDGSGNFYGTTYFGGANGDGTVFELSNSTGYWTESILYNFANGTGVSPDTGLLMDSSGALYGTTESTYSDGTGYGTVFELKQSGGVWTWTLLYTFTGGADGGTPEGILIRDSKGALYGTTVGGGADGGGTVFKVFQSGGVWKEKVLYSFVGEWPWGGLRWNGTGGLYGTTQFGGGYGKGAVFELTQSGGVWIDTVLHSFNGGSDGLQPLGQVILDKSGNLFGTAWKGGTHGYGTVWEVEP